MDIPEFFPIFVRNEADIRQAMDDEANRDLTPEDADWVDTRPGSPYYLATQPSVLQIAAAYERMNEAVGAAILITTWGQNLDLIAWGYGQLRRPAVQAVGTVLFTGENGTLIGTGTKVSPVQIDPNVVPPVFETTQSGTISGGQLSLAIRAVEAGAEGNVAAGQITFLQSTLPGIATVTNSAATTDGADEENDEQLKERLQLYFDGRGSGTQADYARWALSRSGVGRVKVVPTWDGPGTVKVVVMGVDGDPVSNTIVSDVQTFLDPVPGQGQGQAPINHEVTVATPAVTQVWISATIQCDTGYSLTGANGTVDLTDQLDQIMSDYVDQLNAGEDVVFNHVLGQFFKVSGVVDVSTVRTGTVDPPAGTVDIVVDDSHVAQLGGTSWA